MIIDLTNPLTTALLVIAASLLIFLAKELKKPYIAAMPLIFFLILIVVHSIQIANISEVNYEVIYSTLLRCITIDLIMLFVTFFGYLWIDDIACRYYKKKSIDNSLDWFWKQV